VPAPRPPGVKVDARVIGEVGTDAGQRDLDRDADVREMVGAPDARTHQDRRAAVRACGQDHHARPDLGTVDQPDTDGATSVEHDPVDLGAGPDEEVRRTVAGRQVRVV
jgi:hypothetical protein